MPHLKKPKKREQLWKEHDFLADKRGFRDTVYSVNGDEYTGQWNDNLKNGKGTYKWKTNGALYDGDWKNNKRNGFGSYNLPNGDGTYKKIYSGGWKNDKRHGYGTHFYKENEYYEGEWYCDDRSGWGRMYYADGSIYEGEWFDDQENGQGMYRLPTDNRYEGTWKDGMKNGEGKFYYLDKGQVYEGTWLNNVPKCGEMKDFDRDHAPDVTKYQLPELELLDSDSVLRDAQSKLAIEQD